MKKIIEFILGIFIVIVTGLFSWCACVISSRKDEKEDDNNE